MFKTACWIFLGLAQTIAGAQEASLFHFAFDQSFGSQSVGFKVLQMHDHSRPFAGDAGTGRPLQVLVWYPAISGKASPMKLGDFETLIARETDFDNPSTHGPSQDFVHAFMHGTESLETVSTENAAPNPHRFPLVVYAPSLNAPNFENIELCEYLASYGFVVIASPSMGASTRHMTADEADIEAQSADILFLVNSAKTFSDVDSKSVALVGYSLGGSAALFASTKVNVRALVAFDGSFRYGQVSPIDTAKLAIPLLFFSRGETPLATPELSDATQKTNARILNNWSYGDLLQVRMLAVSHIQFSSLYQRSERFKREGMTFVPTGYSLTDGVESYGWIARYTKEFLEAYLKRDQPAYAFLMRSPGENSVPSKLMTTGFMPASRH